MPFFRPWPSTEDLLFQRWPDGQVALNPQGLSCALNKTKSNWCLSGAIDKTMKQHLYDMVYINNHK